MLSYCGYIGGSGTDYGLAVAVDASGAVYIAGYTNSTQTNFPVSAGPDTTHNTGYDAFVAKVNASGTALVYCGYIGGSGDDMGRAIAVDASGNVYVTGETASSEATFPVSVGPDTTHNGGTDAFVAKVNAAGTALVYCGYIGGSGTDIGRGIAVDGSGNAYVTGETTSSEATFPEAVGPDLTYNGYNDVFVAKVNAAGTGLDYCGYIGGQYDDVGNGIAVDGSGNAYVGGNTANSPATGFPVTVGPDLTFNNGTDAFVAKVNAAGTALVYCGYIGGSSYDTADAIAVDSSGNAYVTGYTSSTETTFPVSVGPDLTHNGGNDAFVAKVKADGTGLDYCGYIGGSGADYGKAIAVDSSGNAYVGGYTASDQATFPVSVGPDTTHNGDNDAFVAKVKADGTVLTYCGYIGGSGNDRIYGLAVDGSGNLYAVGYTASDQATFPVSFGPDTTHNGGNDAFVAKIATSETSLPIGIQIDGGYVGDVGGWKALGHPGQRKLVRDNDGYWYAVWGSYTDSQHQIYINKSTNTAGTAWNTPVKLVGTSGILRNTANQLYYPSIDIDRVNNKIHLVWQENEGGSGQLFYSKLVDLSNWNSGSYWKSVQESYTGAQVIDNSSASASDASLAPSIVVAPSGGPLVLFFKNLSGYNLPFILYAQPLKRFQLGPLPLRDVRPPIRLREHRRRQRRPGLRGGTAQHGERHRHLDGRQPLHQQERAERPDRPERQQPQVHQHRGRQLRPGVRGHARGDRQRRLDGLLQRVRVGRDPGHGLRRLAEPGCRRQTGCRRHRPHSHRPCRGGLTQQAQLLALGRLGLGPAGDGHRPGLRRLRVDREELAPVQGRHRLPLLRRERVHGPGLFLHHRRAGHRAARPPGHLHASTTPPTTTSSATGSTRARPGAASPTPTTRTTQGRSSGTWR